MNIANHAAIVDALANTIRPGVWLPIVKAVGVEINLTELTCWREYQIASDRRNCGTFKKRLRRFFFPSLHRRYDREFIAAQVKLQDEFLNVVLERGVK